MASEGRRARSEESVRNKESSAGRGGRTGKSDVLKNG